MKQRTGLKLVVFVGVFSEGFSSELNTVRLVDDSVEDRVGQRRLANDFMPVRDGQLSGEDG